MRRRLPKLCFTFIFSLALFLGIAHAETMTIDRQEISFGEAFRVDYTLEKNFSFTYYIVMLTPQEFETAQKGYETFKNAPAIIKKNYISGFDPFSGPKWLTIKVIKRDNGSIMINTEGENPNGRPGGIPNLTEGPYKVCLIKRDSSNGKRADIVAWTDLRIK